MQVHQVKYPTLCTHDFHKSLTNQIQLNCKDNSNRIHHISQMGKICNKCTHIIKDSLKYLEYCLVCAEELEEYVRDRELCPHQHREFSDIIIKCLNSSGKTHQVPFRTNVCKRCCDKLRAAFMNKKQCKVCDGQQAQVIKDMQKTYISSAYSYFKSAITYLSQKKAPEAVFQNQIQSACKSQPKVQRKQNVVDNKLLKEYQSADIRQNHQSKRYKLYTKCRKHKQIPILVCNNCMVALLNLDCCPFGCSSQEKTQKVTKDKQIKISETGFLSLYPLQIEKKCYLELFIYKLIEERGRMDRWQARIQRISPKSDHQNDFKPKFPLFYSSVAVSNREFLVSGGAIGNQISNLKQTNQAFVVSLTQDLKQYSIIEIAPMKKARSGHSLIFHESRKIVFAVGGLNTQNKMFSKSTELYNIENQEWYELQDMNIERSKPTTFIHQDTIFVMGGMTTNEQYVQIMAEAFNYETQCWEPFPYGGFDTPSITNCSPSNILPSLRDKSPLIMFGGSNLANMVNFIQPVDIDTKNKQFRLNHLNIYHELKSLRTNPVLGFIKSDTILCFGGVEEYQNFLDVEGFTLKIDDKKKQVSIFCALDQISIGSYRLILREDAKVTYKRLYDQLQKMGLINGHKLSKKQDKNVAEAQNNHLIEHLWYTFGKSFVWVPL